MKTTATILTAIVFTFLSIFSFGQEKYKVSVKVKGTGENFIAFLIDNDENFPGVTPTSRQLTQNSDGTFAIFEFDNPESARFGADKLNGTPFDKSV